MLNISIVSLFEDIANGVIIKSNLNIEYKPKWQMGHVENSAHSNESIFRQMFALCSTVHRCYFKFEKMRSISDGDFLGLLMKEIFVNSLWLCEIRSISKSRRDSNTNWHWNLSTSSSSAAVAAATAEAALESHWTFIEKRTLSQRLCASNAFIHNVIYSFDSNENSGIACVACVSGKIGNLHF